MSIRPLGWVIVLEVALGVPSKNKFQPRMQVFIGTGNKSGGPGCVARSDSILDNFSFALDGTFSCFLHAQVNGNCLK